MSGFDRGDYKEVADRIDKHRDRDAVYPDGRFNTEITFQELECDGYWWCPGEFKQNEKGKWYQARREIPHDPHGVTFALGRAWFYRDASDVRPGVGHAWLRVPGSTPYTRGVGGSECGDRGPWPRFGGRVGVRLAGFQGRGEDGPRMGLNLPDPRTRMLLSMAETRRRIAEGTDPAVVAGRAQCPRNYCRRPVRPGGRLCEMHYRRGLRAGFPA